VYVRRHLLLTARHREKYHKAWLCLTGIGIVPLLPLALTPLTKLPIFYVGYRIYSHHQAWLGTVAVLEYLQNSDKCKMIVPVTQAAGLDHCPSLHTALDSSVTTRLIFMPDEILTSIGGARERCAAELPAARFTLREIIDIRKHANWNLWHRGKTLLSDQEAALLAEHYKTDAIVAAVGKIRKKALKRQHAQRLGG
jgi:hypothetical protein